MLLGLAAVLLRRLAVAPRVGVRAALACAIGSLLASGAHGLLGAWLAWRAQAVQTGLLFTLAGAIFALRPARRPAPARR